MNIDLNQPYNSDQPRGQLLEIELDGSLTLYSLSFK
ncbi:hypothetical protein FLB_10570 [Flavobacterium succinicans]|uniref:Uncharacterized protein n=1 Tax=Flavobacterium succinicans TaxID=29536 RepID=A0A199XSB8_9FLAO|nr:hypothetical protein FLB_10570 [Flavobacterium succinicans]